MLKNTERDTLQRFIFEHAPIRGELVHLDASWRAVLERQEYPEAVRRLLGEMMAASALLASTLKFDGLLTLQIQGSGPVSLAVMEVTSERTLRGIAKWREEPVGASLQELIGNGMLAITIEPRKGGERYQGIVEITGDTLADSLEHYLRHSEQLDTHLWLSANAHQACGMLVQKMPGDMSDEQHECWERAVMLARTLTLEELTSLSSRDILRRLFHEEDIRLFDPEPCSFRCNCSRDRVANMLRGLGHEEVQDILQEESFIEVTCEFCSQRYRFDPVDAEQLFASDITFDGSPKRH